MTWHLTNGALKLCVTLTRSSTLVWRGTDLPARIVCTWARAILGSCLLLLQAAPVAFCDSDAPGPRASDHDFACCSWSQVDFQSALLSIGLVYRPCMLTRLRDVHVCAAPLPYSRFAPTLSEHGLNGTFFIIQGRFSIHGIQTDG